jgi:hypothetical protein
LTGKKLYKFEKQRVFFLALIISLLNITGNTIKIMATADIHLGGALREQDRVNILEYHPNNHG